MILHSVLDILIISMMCLMELHICSSSMGSLSGTFSQAIVPVRP